MFQYKSEDKIDKNEKISIIKYNTQKTEKEHTHDFIEIEYVLEGCCYQQINGSSFLVKKGDLLFFNFGDKHSIEPVKETEIINCILNPEFVSNELVNSENAFDILTLTSFNDFEGDIGSVTPQIKFAGKELIKIEEIFECMFDEFTKKEAGYMTALKGYMNILLIKIFRAAKNTDTVGLFSDIGKITPEVLRYIEENYNKKLTLNELAKANFYNPAYFSRIFKECYGKSLTEYINEKRLDISMKLLKETDLSIENIGQQVGYADKKHFYKMFKNHTDMTPNTYRRRVRS